MIILGIETSCDETSIAVLEVIQNTAKLRAHFVYSQISTHAQSGGVIPEVAARLHVPQIIPMIEESLQTAQITSDEIDAIAVTAGPGLVTSLLVGIHTARVLSYAWNKPIIPVNHMHGHVVSSLLSQENLEIQFPALCLTVSGGHTELVKISEWNSYEIIGKTRDDAVGEAFDKVGKLLGFEYPGGPKISQAAESATQPVEFSAPMLHSDNLDFSFSGLKTAVRYYIQDLLKDQEKLTPKQVSNIAAGFENTAIHVLIEKTKKAIKKENIKTLLIGGGVAANKSLREKLLHLQTEYSDLQILIPNREFCTDNAAMIALAGYFSSLKNNYAPYQEIKADPNWQIGTQREY